MKNYRAFAEEVVVTIPEGHHLLVYGENGSGKSSLFRGVRGLLRSSSTDFEELFEQNIFSDSTEGEINFKLSDGSAFKFSQNEDDSTTDGETNLILAAKIGAFLDYKRLLPIYQGGDEKEGKNVFNLVIRSVIANQVITDPRTGTDSRLKEVYEEIAAVITSRKRNSRAADLALSHLESLEGVIRQLLSELETTVNELLATYFKNNISIRFSLDRMGLSSQYSPKVMHERLRIVVTYARQSVTQYGSFLNEARLSSLAICLFLASIKSNPLAAGTLRILYLDDVFIGMDISNRIPLLEILRDEFIKKELSNPFQLILSMYDRHWYELAERWLKNEKVLVKTLEMYARPGTESKDPDVPVVLDRSSDAFEQALAHFAIGDYPACAVNLRKAAERVAKGLIPQSKHFHHYPDGTQEPRGLAGLMDEAKNRLRDYLDYPALFDRFSRIRGRILNPYAHDDAMAPFFRREVAEAIEILRELRSYSVVRLVAAADEVSVTHTYENRTATIVFEENLEALYKDGARLAVLRTNCRCDDVSKHSKNIQQAVRFAWSKTHKGEGVADPETVYDQFFLADGRTLAHLLNNSTPTP